MPYRPTKKDREALGFTIDAVMVTITITGASLVVGETQQIRWPGVVEGHWFNYADPTVKIKLINATHGVYQITAPYDAWISRGVLKNIKLEIAEQPKWTEE